MREPDKSNKRTWRWRRSRLARDLIRDEAGGVLLYMTILIPVMMGVIGLALDASRLFLLNTEQRDLADAAALAAARELDRTSAGIDAAVDAAHNLVTNDPAWANDAEPEFHISSVLFCDEQSCATPVDATAAKADPGEARFVMTTAELRLVYPSFLVFIDAVSPAYSNAIAIAGSSMVACNVTPLMMCEGVSPALLQKGVLFELKGDTQLGAGVFALLDPPGTTNSGASLTEPLLAQTSPNFCFVNDVSVATGQRNGPVANGINVRFDMYPENNGSTYANIYPPAPIVTKGKEFKKAGNNCKFPAIDPTDPPTELVAMPPDNCFLNNTCKGTEGTAPVGETQPPASGSFYGDGQWDRNGYWEANHAERHGGDYTLHLPADVTRYEMYEWEASNPLNAPYRPGAQEVSTPQCQADIGTTPTIGDLNRRSIYVSVVDCSGISGNSTPKLESARYGEFFLISPSEGGEIRAEFVRWIEPDDDTGILRRIIQLYR